MSQKIRQRTENHKVDFEKCVNNLSQNLSLGIFKKGHNLGTHEGPHKNMIITCFFINPVFIKIKYLKSFCLPFFVDTVFLLDAVSGIVSDS